MHTNHYTSADGPEDDATWSVYREQYVRASDAEPIAGSQRWVSRHPNQSEADAEARRLQSHFADQASRIAELEEQCQTYYQTIQQLQAEVATKRDSILTLTRQRDEAKAEVRRVLVDKLDHALDIDHLNSILEDLDMEPVMTAVEVDVTLTMRMVVDVTNNEDTSLQKIRDRIPDFLTVTDGRAHVIQCESYELREIEDANLTITQVQPRI